MDALISLEKRHADNILSGAKQVELRRRTMNISPGATVWLYAKMPVGEVLGYVIAESSFVGAPSTVWRKYGPVSGLTKSEFMNYFEGSITASALGISSPQRLRSAVSLDSLRLASPGFQPPQFFCRLDRDSTLSKLLRPQVKS